MNNRFDSFWFPGRLILILMLSVIGITLQGQTLMFDVYKDTVKLGYFKAVREVNDESEKIVVTRYYESVEQGRLSTEEWVSKSTYMDGALQESLVTLQIGNQEQIWHATYPTENGNRFEYSPYSKHNYFTKPLYGDDLLYFEEPVKIRKVYSLFNGELRKLSKKDQTYTFKVFGQKRHYHYESGVLTHITYNNTNIIVTRRSEE